MKVKSVRYTPLGSSKQKLYKLVPTDMVSMEDLCEKALRDIFDKTFHGLRVLPYQPRPETWPLDFRPLQNPAAPFSAEGGVHFLSISICEPQNCAAQT